MNRKNNSIQGELKISENVVKKIAGLAVLEVKGVSRLSEGNSFLEGICPYSPVSVRNLGGIVEITVKVILSSKANASRTAVNIQNSVKETVQSMTGIPVSKVDVVVDGAEFDE